MTSATSLSSAPGADDPTAATLAAVEDRILVTEDFDFGELVVRRRVSLPALLLLALGGQCMTTRVQRVLEAVNQIGDDLRGQITVVEIGRERFRPIVSE